MDSQYGVASSVALSAYIGIAIACVTVLGIVISSSVYVNRRRKKIERERYQNGYFETQYKPMEYVIRDSSEVPAYSPPTLAYTMQEYPSMPPPAYDDAARYDTRNQQVV
ncbi:hypothetical protein FT663_03454 [Candidozyma haemuli var. vulneris]|uniref:Uncharacterized protein n=1 Tax=Candidozyma haemuli TaxID=45357 RepID=A0A2V1AW45_9ASCO|nr:hypothetical protein CXQ85_000524 [[Candida] haemuloni]KAF3988248.1 hypothetical protein FT662_03519 [[Candida] haemuloni var. vulneris]KAF3989793.1 hypothetical protein FT663_03454 [[Candida] haemuloni var. vulneris]PVH21543.1 hypothetical protein CXQ85_000524 [[Candida] haemuloni]